MNENKNRIKTTTTEEEVDEFVFIGTLGKTVGMDGMISVIPLTSFPERFNELKSVFLTKERKTPLNFDVEKTTYTSNKSRVNMKLKGIDSEKKNIRRVKTLEKDYLMYENKDRLLKYYKIGNPRDNKSYKEVVFRPALSELLADNPYKKEIIKTLENKIYTPQTPTK